MSRVLLARVRVELCLALFLACGCSSTGQGDTRSPAAVLDFDQVFEELNSLRLQGDSTDPIGLVYDVVVWHGQYVLLDQMASNLKVFDTEGHLIRTIGRVGDGPGEFRFPFRAAVPSDGRLVVFDFRQDRVSVFDWPGVFRHSWTIASAPPGGIAVFGDTLIVAARLADANRQIDSSESARAVQVYALDGTRLGGVMKAQRPAGPYGLSFGTPVFGHVGRVLLLAEMDTNLVRFYDLDKKTEWTRVVSQATYEGPSYPRKRPEGIQSLTQWATSQWWTMNVMGIGPARFIAAFSNGGGDKPLRFRYSVETAAGEDVVATHPTPIRLVGASGDTVFAVSELLAGGADMRLFRLRSRFRR